MVHRGNGCQRPGLQGLVRSRPEAVAGVAAAMDAATRGRALATGPPALLLRHAGKAVHPSAFRTILPTLIRRAVELGSE